MEDIDASEVEKAKEFWRNIDVTFVFNALCNRLQYLRERIEAHSATDREFIVGMNIILASELYISEKTEPDFNEETLLLADILPVAVTEGDTPEWNVGSELLEDNSGQSPPFSPGSPGSPSLLGRDKLLPPSPLQFDTADVLSPLLPSEPEDPLAPLSPGHAEGEGTLPPPTPAQTGRASPIAPLSCLQPVFQPHSCSWICLPHPTLPANHPPWGRNPLKLPLVWGFQRQHATSQGAESGGPLVTYKAPCGRSLRGPQEALCYLRETGGDAQLHLGHFSFSAAVHLQSRALRPGGPRELLDADISRGAEPMAVQLWNEVDGARPEKFRYRSQRWPRGCLPGAGPVYVACCDCADGCADQRRCACLQLSRKLAPAAQLYRFRRLPRPVPSGLYECGPWCGCDRTRCQNRVVQRGLQVRLQVFRTPDRGWGVRCIDDLDEGTFVCTYTGVVLRAGPNSGASCLGALASDPSPHKRRREEQSSDDEVEVVEEWRVPAVETATPPNPETPNPASSASPTVHVSVIKMPTGPPAPADSQPAEQEPLSAGALRGTSPSSVSHSLLAQTDTEAENGKWEAREAEPQLNSEWAWLGEGGDGDESHAGVDEEHLYYLDATEEGNVGRFLNHSCCPNLFVQNVFIDSHHRDFPTVAFFTSRVVTAGTELTWNYSYDPGSVPEQEVPCQCGCESCKGVLI